MKILKRSTERFKEVWNGVLSFRTMLLELVEHLDTAKNYEKSDLLQILRILKTYDLLKDAQLDLFAGAKLRKNS